MSYKILKNEADELLFEAIVLGEKLGTILFAPQGENLFRTTTNEEGTNTSILIPSNSSYNDYCN